MNTTIKRFLLLSVFAATFVSCSSDDDNNTTAPALDGVITSLTDADYSATDLKGNIGADITLPVGEYILNGALVVKSPYTLTILPGTTFKATAGGTAIYVAVEQGAKINAAGSATAPIRFTSNASNKRSGDWGGLLIMGRAPLSGGGTATTEVVDFTYGGTVNNDNSGTLSYVIVEYSGARINGEKEFNGITFYGVGNGTTVNNIASLNGDDDAIEFFGGSVNVTNVLVVNAKDDMLDWTQGYTGTINNAYAIRELGFNDITSDPRGIEADGNLDGLSPTQAGQSDVTVTNVTIVNNSIVSLNDIIKIRRGSKATITNCLVKQGNTTPAPGDLVDCSDTLGSAAAGTTVTLVGSGTNLNLADNNLGSNAATVNATAGSTGGANTSVLTWTGYTFN
ncbi:hypothetical protein [Flavobacterium sp.]|uniref:hypothetical protein n=1 Tax=Flavobacterium sp. TaxID=239 RepID=UPI0026090373|nr:hypothetical protein [Flavobacterium sp.]